MLTFVGATSDASDNDPLSNKAKAMKQDSLGNSPFVLRTRIYLTRSFFSKISQETLRHFKAVIGESEQAF